MNFHRFQPLGRLRLSGTLRSVVLGVLSVGFGACAEDEVAGSMTLGQGPEVFSALSLGSLSRVREVIETHQVACIAWDGPSPDGTTDTIDSFRWDSHGRLTMHERDRSADGSVDFAITFENDDNHSRRESWDLDVNGDIEFERLWVYDEGRLVEEAHFAPDSSSEPNATTKYIYEDSRVVARHTFAGTPVRLTQTVEVEWVDGLVAREKFDVDLNGQLDLVIDYKHLDGREVSKSWDFGLDGVDDRQVFTWSPEGLLLEDSLFDTDSLVRKVSYKYLQGALVSIEYRHMDHGGPWIGTPHTAEDCP